MQLEQTPFQDFLVRGLTHRMNNILTLFHGYVGLLLDKQGLDKTTREGLKKIEEGARAASELMDRTHSLVRPSAIVWREVDLAEFVPLLKSTMDGFCGPHTSIEIDVAEDLPRVRSDLSRLKTAIFELVRNACEATVSGGNVRIELRAEKPAASPSVSASNASQPIHWVSISVTDDGPGIAAEARDKIFQPFYSTKRKDNAAGLGLNVAAGCVEQIGGVIRHESKPGGTRFQILIPASI
jgi:two-component system, cell cycle sensor histidine kinase and response regulator CckA